MLTAEPTSTDSQTSFRNCVETRQKAGQKTFGLPCTAPGRTLPAFLEPPCRCFPHRRSTKGTVIIACLMTVVAPCCTLFDLHTVWGGPVASQRFNFQCCTILQAWKRCDDRSEFRDYSIFYWFLALLQALLAFSLQKCQQSSQSSKLRLIPLSLSLSVASRVWAKLTFTFYIFTTFLLREALLQRRDGERPELVLHLWG